MRVLRAAGLGHRRHGAARQPSRPAHLVPGRLADVWWAVSTRSATGEGERLGRPGLGRQELLEDLARGAVAEAAPRRVVEAVGPPPQADARERLGLAVAGEETPDPPVRVLDGAFLPGGVRVAELGLHREVAV